MRAFNRDHPHPHSKAGVLSCEEIRYWIRTLLANGWRRTALALALGFHDSSAKSTLAGKIRKRNPGWIYPSEQLRITNCLAKILSGEIVCAHIRGRTYAPVLADHPVPLTLPRPWRYNLAAGRMERCADPRPKGPQLPSFRSLIDRPVEHWDPPKRHGRHTRI